MNVVRHFAWDIYLSRLTSAFCLFLILAEANVWLDPLNNLILVLGYRLFILLTPLCFLILKQRLSFYAFALTQAGFMCWLGDYLFLGTLFFAIGISISGYMLKYYSSFTTKGASGNKIALNLGSIFSGIAVIFTQNVHAILVVCLIVMVISFYSFIRYYWRDKLFNLKLEHADFNFKTMLTKLGLAWGLIGFVTGVKLIAIVSILPQFLIQSHHGELPVWYGTMLILNSIVVVVFQLPIMNRIKQNSRIAAIMPLVIGMMLICLSSVMGLTTFIGALSWTLILSFIECALSYLDKLARDDGLLLIKEACVGLGSAATVFLVRYFDPSTGSYLIGLVSIGTLLVSLTIFSKVLAKAGVSVEISGKTASLHIHQGLS